MNIYIHSHDNSVVIYFNMYKYVYQGECETTIYPYRVFKPDMLVLVKSLDQLLSFRHSSSSQWSRVFQRSSYNNRRLALAGVKCTVKQVMWRVNY